MGNYFCLSENVFISLSFFKKIDWIYDARLTPSRCYYFIHSDFHHCCCTLWSVPFLCFWDPFVFAVPQWCIYTWFYFTWKNRFVSVITCGKFSIIIPSIIPFPSSLLFGFNINVFFLFFSPYLLACFIFFIFLSLYAALWEISSAKCSNSLFESVSPVIRPLDWAF